MRVELISFTKSPEDTCEIAASECYASVPTSNHSIIKSCYKTNHTSVLEHAQFTFKIEGVSRALLAQLTRHRHAGYSVKSQRYVNEDNFSYVIPEKIKNNEQALSRYLNCMYVIKSTYKDLVNENVPIEDARMVLPNACTTSLTVSMNARALINFMNLRLCTRAQSEIRQLAIRMKALVKDVAPDIAEMLVPSCESDDRLMMCTERQSCGRHPHISEIVKKLGDEA